jgi:hypothetical protein
MLKKISTLIEYIAWLYNQNIELQKSTGSIFRIINAEKNKHGEHIIEVQVINKSTVFKCGANEIAAQDQLLECFSKSDVRMITYLATEDLLKPKKKIIGFEYDGQTEKTFLKIRHHGSDQLLKITADKISNNPELLNELSQEDAHKAGYLTATEQMILEKKAIERFKKGSSFS